MIFDFEKKAFHDGTLDTEYNDLNEASSFPRMNIGFITRVRSVRLCVLQKLFFRSCYKVSSIPLPKNQIFFSLTVQRYPIFELWQQPISSSSLTFLSVLSEIGISSYRQKTRISKFKFSLNLPVICFSPIKNY